MGLTEDEAGLVVAALPDVLTIYRPCPAPIALGRGGWTLEKPSSGWTLVLETRKVDAEFGVVDGSVVLCEEPTSARLERVLDDVPEPELQVGEVLVPKWTPAGPFAQRLAWANASTRLKDRSLVVVRAPNIVGEVGVNRHGSLFGSANMHLRFTVDDLHAAFDRDPRIVRKAAPELVYAE